MAGESEEVGDDPKGSLVKKLVETKRQLEGEQRSSSGDVRLGSRSIERLKSSIQELSRLANPLGRVLDYLQEDMEAMLMEIEKWNEETTRNEALLGSQSNPNDGEMRKLQQQSQSLGEQIEQAKTDIEAVKGRLHEHAASLISTVTATVENA